MSKQDSLNQEIIKLKIPSKPIFIRKTRQVIDEICEGSGFSKRKTMELKLVMNEALANIIEHGYDNQDDQCIYIYFVIHPERMEVIIRDFGKKPEHDLLKSRNLEEIDDRGLGLLFMERYVDVMNFNFNDEGENQLKFIKYKTAEDCNYSLQNKQ